MKEVPQVDAVTDGGHLTVGPVLEDVFAEAGRGLDCSQMLKLGTLS